jgi:hypothetical protein
MLRIMKRAPWIAVGAVGAWLLDGTNGEERRRRLRKRVEDAFNGDATVRPPMDLGVDEGRAA